MSIEIEKKYRLTKAQGAAVRRRLPAIGAKFQGKDFEENIIYGGKALQIDRTVLRLRRAGDKATLTYKKRFSTNSPIKRQREHETLVDDPEALNSILTTLGFTPTLVYEKRREIWVMDNTEIVLDELPFGLFMEIEGKSSDINAVEARLALRDLQVEDLTYPQLTAKHGEKKGRLVEARFKSGDARKTSHRS